MSINNTYPTIDPKDGMKFVTSGYGNYNITIEDLATYIGDSGGGGSTTVTTESISDATTLQTGRTFTITGGATGVGNTSFNGSQNITIDVEITPATTTTVGGVLKVSGVEDTSGEDLLAVKNTLNELLANLRTAGVMT